MANIDSRVFFELKSDSGQRALHPAEIVGSKERAFAVKVRTAELMYKPGQKPIVFYDKDRTFVKQQTLVESCDTMEDFVEIQFTLLGEPMVAEQREVYRVSSVIADLHVDIGEETGCKLVDISTTGLSAIAGEKYRLDQVLRIALYPEDEPIGGKAVVRNMKQLDRDRIRYGLACVLDRDSGGALKKALHEITMSIQRSHLRRQSRG